MAAAIPAQAAFEPQFHPTLNIHKASAPITIDGDLGDAGWSNAARATGFAEVSPGDQTEPAVHSEAWITYDERNLYVAFLAQDDPDEVRVEISPSPREFLRTWSIGSSRNSSSTVGAAESESEST